MRRIILLIFLTHVLFVMPQDKQLFIATEPMPTYPGGEEALTKFIKENLVYPEFAQIKGIEGQVIAQFNITSNGDVVNIRIKKSLEASCDSAVVEMIKAMPKWLPINRHKLSDEFTLPINFSLPSINGRKIYDYTNLDQFPSFPGGEKALFSFIKENLQYPYQEIECQGKVIIRFIVTKEGKIELPEVKRSLSPELDNEALRVVNLMPDWIPAKHKGNNVDVYFILPIVFKIRE